MSDVGKERDEILDAIGDAVDKYRPTTRDGRRRALELLNELFDDLSTRINDFDAYYIGHTRNGAGRRRAKREAPIAGVTKLAPVIATATSQRELYEVQGFKKKPSRLSATRTGRKQIRQLSTLLGSALKGKKP